MELKEVMALYAAIISTAVFVWRLFEWADSKKGKLKIKHFLSAKQLVFGDNSFGQVSSHYVFSITNHGFNKRYISGFLFEADKKLDGDISTFTLLDILKEYNKIDALEPGQNFKIEFPVLQFGILQLQQQYHIKKFRLEITDSLGKKYHSNWARLQ
jgi:hypothetical protein